MPPYGVERQCAASFGSQISLTCIGPISTVPFVFWLTLPELAAFDLEQDEQRCRRDAVYVGGGEQAGLDVRDLGSGRRDKADEEQHR